MPMNLYSLVSLRQALLSAVIVEPAVSELQKLRTSVENIKLQFNTINDEHDEYIQNTVADITEIINSVEQQSAKLHAGLDSINDQINEITHKLFAGNYDLEKYPGSIEAIRNNRRISAHPHVETIIKQRIALHTYWKYPALEIGCRDGDWTHNMVAADPLYLIDPYQEFLDSTSSQFTPDYQNRLRKYLLQEHNLSMLPQQQMSFVFSWGYFNYVSIDTMKLYLQQVFDLLRPGGIFMFSFNDGDTIQGAGMAESFCQSYMPRSLLVPLCESLGYAIYNYFNQFEVSWIEIQKPGELHTVKAHQVMGEIKNIGH